MLKRLLAALCCVACIALSGCSFIWPNTGSSGTSSDSFQVSAAQLREYQDKWCYQRLDGRLQKAYSAVYAAVKKSFSSDETVTISDTGKGEKREYPGVQVTLPEPLQGEAEAKNSTRPLQGTTRNFSISATFMDLMGTSRVDPAVSPRSSWCIL